MAKHSIEKENLEAHVDLCSERYDSLLDKIDRLEHRMSDVELVTKDILNKLTQMENRQNSVWIKTASGAIALLIAVIGFLVVNFVIA
jgi:hypothetical protein